MLHRKVHFHQGPMKQLNLRKGENSVMNSRLDYAVTLEFDKETTNKIQEIIEEVAKVTGCDYMIQSKIPPHVTVSALISDNEEALLLEMESIAETMKKEDVWFVNIGVFNPLVIYLGPVMNEFLENTCKMVNDRLLKYAEVGNRGRYLPNQWVPHAGVAVKLTPQALIEAFAIVQEKFSAFRATAEKIVLVRVEPYEELRSWKLK